MKNILLIISLLISINSFSEEIKIKANLENNIVKVKILTASPSSNKVYISHIEAKACENIVYDMSTSEYLSKYSGMQFSYFDFYKCEDIELILTDNLNNQKIKKVKIKNYSSSTSKDNFRNQQPIEKLQYDSNIWKATTPEKAINILYGNKNYIKNKIKLQLPSLSENLDKVGIKIKSDIRLKSIAIFENSNPFSTLSIISVPRDGIIDYTFSYQFKRICNIFITIVAQGLDGKLYKDTQRLNWGDGDIRCTGYNTISGNGGGG